MARRKQPTIPDQLLDQLLAGADPKTAFDKDGLLDGLKKALAERALNAEMDHHLDAEPAGNSRNGYGKKAVLTDTSRLEIEVPRDRLATFDPQLVAKYHRASADARSGSRRDAGRQTGEGAASRASMPRSRGGGQEQGGARRAGRPAGRRQGGPGALDRAERGRQVLAAGHDRAENRGVEDVPIAIVDGLKGFPEAIAAVFPQAERRRRSGSRPASSI